LPRKEEPVLAGFQLTSILGKKIWLRFSGAGTGT
jgi:hypothetical protein